MVSGRPYLGASKLMQLGLLDNLFIEELVEFKVADANIIKLDRTISDYFNGT